MHGIFEWYPRLCKQNSIDLSGKPYGTLATAVVFTNIFLIMQHLRCGIGIPKPGMLCGIRTRNRHCLLVGLRLLFRRSALTEFLVVLSTSANAAIIPQSSVYGRNRSIAVIDNRVYGFGIDRILSCAFDKCECGINDWQQGRNRLLRPFHFVVRLFLTLKLTLILPKTNFLTTKMWKYWVWTFCS